MLLIYLRYDSSLEHKHSLLTYLSFVYGVAAYDINFMRHKVDGTGLHNSLEFCLFSHMKSLDFRNVEAFSFMEQEVVVPRTSFHFGKDRRDLRRSNLTMLKLRGE